MVESSWEEGNLKMRKRCWWAESLEKKESNI